MKIRNNTWFRRIVIAVLVVMAIAPWGPALGVSAMQEHEYPLNYTIVDPNLDLLIP